ncbi:MAG: tRNA adenosine(34) deaminase TadA [Actinomycetota bacterium]|nr:tRNA adenosine(34) deaminase TadA [Actinomycetota bacterium]MDI6822603.1 tRNA adenosine(34) deaminase TadA [Actinomycetota bacterium]
MKSLKQDDVKYMQLALKEAKIAADQGEVPVGAAVVFQGKVISRAHNECETKDDPTAHAEILAIKKASKYLKGWRLTDCTIYVTKEPCPMCAGAIHQARIDRLVYGTRDEKSGAAGTLYDIVRDQRLNHQVEVTAGVCEEECQELLQKFFQKLRQDIVE